MNSPKPTICIDTREQTPLVFRNLPSQAATLYSGDYSANGLENMLAIERKSVADLVACCVGDDRDRFERELHRLRGFRFKRLLIVGTRAEVESHRYRSNIAPKSVLSTLAAFEVRYEIPIIWAALPEEAALLIEGWAWWMSREVLKAAEAIRSITEFRESESDLQSTPIQPQSPSGHR
jgi:DNA excision repair protein ERCC-4